MTQIAKEKDAATVISMKQQEQYYGFAMLAPAGLLLLIFLITPFFYAIYLSFTDQPLVPRVERVEDPDTGEVTLVPEPAEFIGLENYGDLLRVKIFTVESTVLEDGTVEYERSRTYLRPERLEELFVTDFGGQRYLVGVGDVAFYRSLFNVFLFVLVVVPVQTSFALGLAMLVNQKLPFTEAFRTIYFSPVVTSMAIVSVLWFFLYNPSDGLINTFLGALGIEGLDWLESPNQALLAIIIMSIWQGAGFQMVIYLAGLQQIPDSLYEASGLDGANRIQQFWNITLPSLRNTTLFVAISTTILAFKLFVQVDIMTFGRGGPDNATITPVLHLVNEGFRSSQRVGYASAMAVVFVLIVLGVSLIQRRVLTPEA